MILAGDSKVRVKTVPCGFGGATPKKVLGFMAGGNCNGKGMDWSCAVTSLSPKLAVTTLAVILSISALFQVHITHVWIEIGATMRYEFSGPRFRGSKTPTILVFSDHYHFWSESKPF